MNDDEATKNEAVIMGQGQATPSGAVVEDAMPGDALAMGPDAVDEAALGHQDSATPTTATPGTVPADARTQLKRTKVFWESGSIDAVYDATKLFNSTVTDGRGVDELTLGLLWATEGYPRFKVTLSTTHDAQSVLLSHYASLAGLAAEYKRIWRITAVGLWGFGLDDIFGGTVSDISFYSLAVAKERWKNNLNSYGGWKAAIPFETADPGGPYQVSSDKYELTLTRGDATGFLVAVAARFTKQLWRLPSELEELGISLSTSDPKQLPTTEPVFTYLTFNPSAATAARFFEAALFLQDFSSAVVASAPRSDGTVYLASMIDVLNQWLSKLKDTSATGLPKMLGYLVADETARSASRRGRDVLTAVAQKSGWDPIPAEEELDASGRALLEELQQAWDSYAMYVWTRYPYGVPPGQFLFEGSRTDADVTLINTGDEAGTYGFAIQNYVDRYLEAIGMPRKQGHAATAPLGGGYTRATP